MVDVLHHLPIGLHLLADINGRHKERAKGGEMFEQQGKGGGKRLAALNKGSTHIEQSKLDGRISLGHALRVDSVM